MWSRRLVSASLTVALILLAACEQSPTAPRIIPEDEGADFSPPLAPPSSDFYASLAFGLLITPTGLDFGEAAVGTTAPSQTVTITNLSGSPVVMSGAGGAPPSRR